MLKPFAAAALLALAPLAAFADQTQGTIATYDPEKRLLVLTDKTVWSLETLETAPVLAPGQKVAILYTSDADNGWKTINAVSIVE
ncbi:hypothetical protein LR948_08075 [Roseivivax sp. GX 12232]|uniref:hypothetical protein n=1 Tax=Roseivivax sp. GX 12232 TaxID=2900547 RepID=UPI001E46472B|nr:hypothetical protein [Roseivivax sp. GX 12232]MCE0505304.1 hypothetical protein [Roseivivax sp. GX 12232]